MSVAADNCQHLSTTSKEDEDEMERSEHAVEEKNEIEMDEKEEAVMEQEMDEDKADEAVQSQEDQKGDDMMEPSPLCVLKDLLELLGLPLTLSCVCVCSVVPPWVLHNMSEVAYLQLVPSPHTLPRTSTHKHTHLRANTP